MVVLTLVPCAQDDPRKCKHNMMTACTVRDATHENLRHVGLEAEDYPDALCVFEEPGGNIILCTYCGSFRTREGTEWNMPSENRRVLHHKP